jgi:Protein of unknown function (DUF2975)
MENENMHRIQRLSGIFRLLFTALIICIPVLSLLYWLFFNDLPKGFTNELPVVASQTLPLSSIALAILVSLIPMSVVIYGLLTLKELFKLYERGIVFSTKNVSCFRRLGYTLIAWVLANMIFVTLISVVISFNNPPGERTMVIGFGSSDLATLIIGAVVILISWVMHEASRLEDEQAFTI